MRAVLSGRAAVAILNEGDSWHSMTYEESELLTPCHAAQAKTLLRNAHDLIWLEDVSVDDVRDRLADVVDSTEALDCVLYLLDSRLLPETRDAVALEFEELAAWPEIVQEVESVLLARPLPASADMDGAIAACERTDAKPATQLFRHWHSLQPTVQAVYDAWLQIPIDRFGDTNQQTIAQGHFIKHGIFADLVRTDLQPPSLTTFQFSSSANAQLKHDVPGAVGIINDWLRLLRGQRHFVDHVAFAEYADFSLESEVEQRTPRQRRWMNRHEVKDNVDKQKRLIVDAIGSNDSQRAKRITKELIQYQLANDGKRFVGNSLRDLAMDAQQLGQSQLQYWLTAQAVESVPDDGWSWAQHGKSLLNLRQFADAEIAFQNAVDFGDGEIIRVAKNGLAEVMKAQGNLSGSLAAFEEVIAAYPGDAVAKTGRAEVLKAQGNLSGSLAAFDEVIAAHPENVVAKTGRAEVLKAQGNLSGSLGAFDEVIAAHPGDAVAKTGRAEVLKAQGILSESLAAFDDVISEHPVNVVAKTGRAEVLKVQGNLSGSLAAFDEVIAAHPENVVAKTGRAEVLKAQGNLSGSLAAFDEVIAAHPEHVVAKTGRAEVLKAQGNLCGSLAAFDKVIAAHPEHVVAKTGRVSVLVLMEQWDAALADLPTSEPHSFHEWIQYHIRGMIAFRRNDLITAEAVFERGVFDCPFADSRSFFENALAMVRLKQGRLEDARKLAERNLEGRWQGPMTAVLVHIKGRIGDLESARESFGELPTPPNPSVAEAFAELRLRYVLCEPPEHDEEWLISREVNYLMSC